MWLPGDSMVVVKWLLESRIENRPLDQAPCSQCRVWQRVV
jgi:hypothetical protein